MNKVIKCTIVGDKGVGKSCLLYTYTQNKFPTYLPTILDPRSVNVKFCDKFYTLALFDTDGQCDQEESNIQFQDSDIFLICFNLTSYTSFKNVKERWLMKIQEINPTAKCLIVGTQSDKMITTEFSTLSLECRKNLSTKLSNCYGYVECSSFHGTGINEVFNKAIEVYLQKDDSCCQIFIQIATLILIILIPTFIVINWN